MKFELVEIVTKDKLVHQGIFHRPERVGKRALLWVHGLTGRFYGDPKLMNMFAEMCDQYGMGFAAFNNRGHDMVSGLRRINPRKESGYDRETIGAAYENFEESVFDIDASIEFLLHQGFDQIILVGHSTGANKVCYYAATKNDLRISGVVLAGPMSDRLSQNTDKVNYEKNLLKARELVSAGRGDELLQGKHFFPITPKRIISLLASNTKEDVFNYADTKNILTTFSKIRKPLLMIFSGNDEVADRPVETIKKAFDAYTKSFDYTSIIVPDATHSFEGKETDFVEKVVSWASSL
ncbi:MAG TPA: alpha/beta fold hydrolase [Patescibacteria group bacterium]|nr:alpha/beta fold hydrolase [Patescibacteria group bacterium]